MKSELILKNYDVKIYKEEDKENCAPFIKKINRPKNHKKIPVLQDITYNVNKNVKTEEKFFKFTLVKKLI